MLIVNIFDIPFDQTDDIQFKQFEMFDDQLSLDKFLENYVHSHKGSVSRVVVSELLDYCTFKVKENDDELSI